MHYSGLLTCAAYASPPNALYFCGPEKQSDLFGYLKKRSIDQGLTEIIQDFQTLYPYLTFIAHENNIRDPFDPRVVEAYWIGNTLLGNVSMNKLYYHLKDVLGLSKKIKKKDLTLLFGRLSHGFLPHHTFHVFNIFMRTGHHAITHTIETMDRCRISWGKVAKFKTQKEQNRTMLVETRPLSLENNHLALGAPLARQVNIGAYQPIIDPPSDQTTYVSLHWDTICDTLTQRQVKNLETYTRRAITLANKTRVTPS